MAPGATAVDDEKREGRAVCVIILPKQFRPVLEHTELFESDCFELRHPVNWLCSQPSGLSGSPFPCCRRLLSMTARLDGPLRCLLHPRASSGPPLQEAEHPLLALRLYQHRGFKVVKNLVDTSVRDMKWLPSIFRANKRSESSLSYSQLQPTTQSSRGHVPSLHHGMSSCVEAAEQVGLASR